MSTAHATNVAKEKINAKRRSRHLVTIGAIGILLSLLLFSMTMRMEQTRIRDDFRHAAGKTIGAIDTDLQLIQHDIENLAGFYEGSQNVERSEFQDFSKRRIRQGHSVSAFEWAPLVSHASRPDFEAAVREDGIADFQITEKNEKGEMIPAARQEEYFPIIYIEPYEDNEGLLGLDLASEPALVDTINESRSTGRMVTTERVSLVQEAKGHYGFLTFLPVYRKGAKTDTEEERRANIDGFVISVYRLCDVLAEALTHVDPEGLNIYIYDLSGPPGGQLLAFRPAIQPDVVHALSEIERPGPQNKLRQDTKVIVGGRTWQVLCEAAPQFLAARRTSLPWVTLSAGLLLTGLLIAYARLLLAHGIKMKEFAMAQTGAGEDLCKEIDDRKSVEKALHQSETQKQAILDGITANIVFVNKNLEILWANKAFAEFTGIPAIKLIGHKCHEFIGCSEKPCNGCPAMKTFESGKSEHATMQTSKGRILKITSEPILDGEENMIGVVLIAHDVTEKAMMQRQLAQVHKMEAIGTLASGIAHEINTPTQYVGDNVRFLQDAFNDINGVVTKYSELLEACEAGMATDTLTKDVKKLVAEVDMDFLRAEVPKATSQSLEGIERVASIVRAMKDFAHPGPEEKTPIDLNKAINSTITVARNEWKYVSEMVTEFEPNLPPVLCLAGDFNQVILNLIINASHAIENIVGDGGTEKGTITISTKVDGDFVEVRVKDTGSGIPKDVIPRIFDPFYTTKQVGKGSGQGLAIAHNVIVDKHGGTITIETEVGRGTSFIIRLPLDDKVNKDWKEPGQIEISDETGIHEAIELIG